MNKRSFKKLYGGSSLLENLKEDRENRENIDQLRFVL